MHQAAADNPPGPRRAERWPAVLFLAGWAVVHLCFAPTAFRIDEPNILAIARAIERDASDPYGFEINWIEKPDPAFLILSNPPGVAYWLRLWAWPFGWSETSLHISMLPFSLLALVSFAALARRFAIPNATAFALLASSPAFVVGSHVFMPDVPMLAFFIAAVAAAVAYEETGSPWLGAAGFLFGAMTPLLKYSGILLVPVLACLVLFLPRRRIGMALIAASPLIGLALWSVASWLKYGDAHFIASTRFQSQGSVDVVTALLPILGIGVLPFALAAAPRPERLSRKHDLPFTGLAFVLWFGSGVFVLLYPVAVALWFAVGCTLGLRFLLFAALRGLDALTLRDGLMLVLLVWIAATIAFQFRLLFAATRYVLPLLPAAILLVLARRPPPRLVRLTAWIGVVVCLVVAIGDAKMANVSRSFVHGEIRPLLSASAPRFFFDGHWGFQHYAEKLGGRILAKGEKVDWKTGDVVAIAFNAHPQRKKPGGATRWSERKLDLSPEWPIHTMDCTTATSFYSNGVAGCRWALTAYLPWSLSTAPSERFAIWIAEGRE